MADSLDFYVNMLAGSMTGLAAVGALKSLDDAAAKATSGIQGLEGQVAAAKTKLDALQNNAGIKGLEAQLQGLRSAQDAMRSGALPYDAKAYKHASEQAVRLEKQADAARAKQSAAVDAQKAKIEGLTGKLNEQKAAQASNANLVAAKRAQMVKGLDEQVQKLGGVLSAAKDAGGPVGALARKLEALGKGGAVGIAIAVAVALAAVAASAVLAAVALTRYAIAAADAARSSALLSAAAAGSGSAGWELDRVVDQLSSKIPQARAKTAEWARELVLAGIAGRDMQRTLTTMGVVASAVGDQAAGKIKGIAEASRSAQKLILGARDRFGEFASLQGTGIKAADIYAAVAKSMRTSIPEAKRMVDAGIVPFKRGLEALEQAAETRFGPIVARQMMSLDTQITRLKENLARLFSGANIEAFLAGLKTVTDLFDTNTVMGFALKQVFTEAFTGVANLAAKAFPFVRAAVLGVAFGIIVVATAAKRLYQQFQETFGGSLKGIDGIKLAFQIGAGLVGAFVGAIVGLTAALVALGVIAAIATAPIWIPFVLGAAAVYLTIKAIDALADEMSSLWKELEDIDLGAAAENAMNSLIDGIKAKIADVKAAIASVGKAITGGFDTEMEIRSPSKKMQRRADYVVDPVVDVPKRRTSEVRAAYGALGEAVDFAPGQGGGGRAGGAEPSITFTNCVFGGGDEESVRRIIREERRLFFLGEARGNALAPA